MNYKNINQPEQNESTGEWTLYFKEAYKKELDSQKCPDALQASMQASMQTSMQAQLRQNRAAGHKKTPSRYARRAAAAAIVFCLSVIAVNRLHIISFAESLIQSFILYSDGSKTMKLDAINPVPFDPQSFCSSPDTEVRESKDTDLTTYRHYWQTFDTYHKMHSLTGFSLPNADQIHYQNILLDVDFEHGYGHLVTDLSYQGTEFQANGMFVTSEYQQKDWGYGEDRKISESYEYAPGRSAYFFKSTDSKISDIVYFTEDDIMFQLFVPASDKNYELTKQLLAAMAD